jgi:hypothetical protein
MENKAEWGEWKSANGDNFSELKQPNAKNTQVKFENGYVCNYLEKWPLGIITHFRVRNAKTQNK